MTEPSGPFGPPSPAELLTRLQAERGQDPFLQYREPSGAEVLALLAQDDCPLTIGRGAHNRVCIGWDETMSFTHAEIVSLGTERALVDDGLSRNGSFVNGERVAGRRRLRENDVLRLGQTTLRYRAPAPTRGSTTGVATDFPTAAHVSPAQRRVLVALARPFGDTTGFATPATNHQIATELFLSVDAVKTHLRALAAIFGVQDLPQNQKRARLVERALAAGVITPRELQDPDG